MANEDLKHFEFPEARSSDAEKYPRRIVFWLGEGPGIVLMHELPGLTEFVADFGRQIAANGYTVFMPVMFGWPFPNLIERSLNEAGICINREFFLLSRNRSSPITNWLRALCREVDTRCGEKGIGVVGLCLSGGFVLSLMAEPSVMAPVMSEPALPFCPFRDLQPASQAALGVSPEELQQANERSLNENIPVFGLRFKNDWLCTSRRFDTLSHQFGNHFNRIEFPSEPENSYGISPQAHSVLTEDYDNLEKYISLFPDKDPRKQVIKFLDRQLKANSRTAH